VVYNHPMVNLSGLGQPVSAEDRAAFLRQLAEMRDVATRLPNCGSVDCAALAKGQYQNYGYYARFPPATIQIYFGKGATAAPPFLFTVFDFRGKDLNKPIERTFTLHPDQFRQLGYAWADVSRRLFAAAANRQIPAGPGGITARPAQIPGTTAASIPTPKTYQTLSLNEFLKAFPGKFVLRYKGFTAQPQPTADELSKPGGVGRFMARGGYYLSPDVFGGKVPVKDIYTLWACGQWCRACPGGDWPDGQPVCAEPVEFENQDFTWGVSARMNSMTSATIILQRLPKSTWQRFTESVDWIGRQADRLTRLICRQYESSAGQMAVSAGSSSPNPAIAASTLAVSTVLSQGCRTLNKPVLAPVTIAPDQPPPTPTPPWYRTPPAIFGGVVLVGGLAILLLRASR